MRTRIRVQSWVLRCVAYHSFGPEEHLLNSRQLTPAERPRSMTNASAAIESLPKQRGLATGARFLIQVSRPGLWSTTALFYLLPLGRADFLHSGRLWLGLFFVLFPL